MAFMTQAADDEAVFNANITAKWHTYIYVMTSVQALMFYIAVLHNFAVVIGW